MVPVKKICGRGMSPSNWMLATRSNVMLKVSSFAAVPSSANVSSRIERMLSSGWPVEKLARPEGRQPDPAILDGLSSADRRRVIRYVRLITADKNLAGLEDQRITALMKLAESSAQARGEFTLAATPVRGDIPAEPTDMQIPALDEQR
jgi:hypothetical protein